MFERQHRHVAEYLEYVREEFAKAYVSRLTDLNREIATVFKNARSTIQRSDSILAIPTMNFDLRGIRGDDLIKADKKKPYGHVSYTREDPRTGKVIRVEAKGAKPAEEEGEEEVKLYRDEFGNVRPGTKPTKQFKTELSEAELDRLHSNLSVVLKEIPGHLHEDLARQSGISTDTIAAFQKAADHAADSGVSLRDAFQELYARGIAAEQGKDFNSLPEEEQARLVSQAKRMHDDFAASASIVLNSPEWKKTIDRKVQSMQRETLRTLDRVNTQQADIADFAQTFVTGDPLHEHLKSTGLLWDLGLLRIVGSDAEAAALSPDPLNADLTASLVGQAVIRTPSVNALYRMGHMLNRGHQMLLGASILAGELQTHRQMGVIAPEVEESHWEALSKDLNHPIFEAIKKWHADEGVTHDPHEWAQICSRMVDSARQLSNELQAYNTTDGGLLIKALHNEFTDYKKLAASPEEAERLHVMAAEMRQKNERALAAQEDPNIDLDPAFKAGLKQVYKREDADLFDYQKCAVGWMHTAERGILAAGAGLGKTPIAAAFVSRLLSEGKIPRGNIVVPANLVYQWGSEIEKFRPGSKVVTVSSEIPLEDRIALLSALNKGELKADFVIISAGTISLTEETQKTVQAEAEQRAKKLKTKPSIAETLSVGGHLDRDELVGALAKLDGAWIFDEAHSAGQGLRSPDNIHHIVAKHVLKDRKYRFLMTATPMVEGPEDLFHLSNLVNPGSAGESLTKFRRGMVSMQPVLDPETGVVKKIPVTRSWDDLEKAKAQIKPHVFFQSKTEKKIVDEQQRASKKLGRKMTMPSLNSVAHSMNLTEAAKAHYEACQTPGFDETHEPMGGYPEGYIKDNEFLKEMTSKWGEATARRLMQMRIYIRKQRAAISPRLIDKDYKGPEPKLDEAVELIKRHFNDSKNAEHPVIIFSTWKDSLGLLKERLKKEKIPESVIETITGDDDMKKRAIVQKGINDGKIKVGLITVQAGGAGLNLQQSSNRMIFLDKPYTPADVEQAVGRVWRTGNPADTVHVHHMKVADTTDERKYTTLGERITLNDALTFCDLGQDYVEKTVNESLKNLRGEMDEPLPSWTPEQKRAMWRLAGLPAGEDAVSIDPKVLDSDFQSVEYRKTVDAETWRKTGDRKIHEMKTLADVKLKAGMISPGEHQKAMKRISKLAKDWLKETKSSMDHPVAQYIGENFTYQTAGSEILPTTEIKKKRGRKASAPRTSKKEQAAIVAALQEIAVQEAARKRATT